jgi:hypothetical protein
MATPFKLQPLGFIYDTGPYSFHAGTGGTTIGRAVKMAPGVANTVIPISVAGEASWGIALSTQLIGEDVSVLQRGRFDKAEAGAALATLYTPLMVDSVGRYVAATTGKVIVGMNVTLAVNVGDAFVIELDAAQRVAP